MVRSNFDFLRTEFPAFFREALDAEKYTFKEPRYSALLCRSAMEKAVLWLYENDVELEMPYDTKLGALLYAEDFKNSIRPSMFRELNVIRLNGNNAAHGKTVNQYEALHSIKNLFRFLSYVSVYYSQGNPVIPPFDETLLPTGAAEDKARAILKKEAEQLQSELDTLKEALKRQQALVQENEGLKKQLSEREQIIQDRKAERLEHIVLETAIPELNTELATRKLLIDLLLKEAGWENLKKRRDIEFKVTGMPLNVNKSGIGFVDYVLWGKNGLPLAVVEAKNTLQNVEKGKHQASLYADCLQKKYRQRPVIYYSNGYETQIWDDTFYPPREVSGFYAQDELQLMVDRRKTRKDLRNFTVDQAIINRYYQLEAVQRVAETLVTEHRGQLRGKNRKALLVMATGSGKTRTSAAIVDMLTKCDWAKRILFLADRNALVSQAKNAFKHHLPHLSAIDLTKEVEDKGTRVVFSTYPTIINKIDGLKNEDGRFYGVGHFDVIIIDEAHRSVYQKYRSIFDYFDSLLIGLTATPKKDIDINTYELFEIEDDNPTFAYELDRAVEDGYLNPPKAIEVPIKFPLEGVKYKELSKKDQDQYESLFGDPTTGALMAEEIGRNELNTWLFNKDTVDKVLHHLMTHGVKVAGGDKLGKTIIFAKNHKHAIFIEKRFNKNYPEYGGTFLRVIDNYAEKAQDLLERFCDDKEELEPQIAVSVDMMDTGVDAPRIVNLVFFKRIKSSSKYWQMVGRGTRLRPDLFGPDRHKEYFVIFDFCGNFEFFDEFPDGMPSSAAKSLSQQLFEIKLDILIAIREKSEPKADEVQLLGIFEEDLYHLVNELDENRYAVRGSWRSVKKFKERENWQQLTKSDITELKTELSQLVSQENDSNEMAKRFDLIVLKLHLALIQNLASRNRYISLIYGICEDLKPKSNVPAIAKKMPTIKAATTDEFWQDIDNIRLEKIRHDIRSLLKFLEWEKQAPVYSNFEDEIREREINERDIMQSYANLKSYKDRVESFIRKNRHHIVIDKLHKNLPITPKELEQLEKFLFDQKDRTKERFVQEYGEQPLGKFVRKIIGLDIEVANQLFSELIQTENLNADQITFINSVVNYLNVNGTIDKSLLTKPPFNENHDKGIFGVFGEEEKIVRIISILDEVNGNAGIA